MPEQQDDPIVVEQSNVNVNALWGFLSAVFALTLWLGHRGAETDAGRLTVDIFAGGLMILSLAGWIWFLSRPGSLLIYRDVIKYSHRGQPNATELRRTGHLYVQKTYGSQGQTHSYLKVSGSDEAISLVMFNWRKVERACLAAGWQIDKAPPPRPRGS